MLSVSFCETTTNKPTTNQHEIFSEYYSNFLILYLQFIFLYWILLIIDCYFAKKKKVFLVVVFMVVCYASASVIGLGVPVGHVGIGVAPIGHVGVIGTPVIAGAPLGIGHGGIVGLGLKG